jgi:hypothetical protein
MNTIDQTGAPWAQHTPRSAMLAIATPDKRAPWQAVLATAQVLAWLVRLTQSEHLDARAAGQGISVTQQPPGSTGARDLVRGAETIEVATASFTGRRLDLLRIADGADGGRRSRGTLALQAGLEVERARAASAPVTATHEERPQAWLDQ